ncbi:MAG: hypothetical protein Q7J54_00295 [Candidatus Woesearchaeota archaeon]|nr:hypothetical protein [Candidatus Woesearchaeota archaeon]
MKINKNNPNKDKELQTEIGKLFARAYHKALSDNMKRVWARRKLSTSQVDV